MSTDLQLSPHPRYRLLARIGRGGMGEVFRMHDRLTGQVIALKRVSLPLGLAPAAAALDGIREASLGEAATFSSESPADAASEAHRFAATLAAASVSQSGEPAASKAVVSVAELPRSAELQALRLHLAQEFRTLAGLRHPHIVSVLDYGFDQSRQPYFTMEFLEGGQTLDEAARSLPLAGKAALLLQILQALTYLHRRGILHREKGEAISDLDPAS